MKVLYISDSHISEKIQSNKTNLLSELGKVFKVTYDSLESYEANLKNLESHIERLLDNNLNNNIVLAGTSIGAFWASVFSKQFGIPAILFNPVIRPALSFKKVFGNLHKDLKPEKRREIIKEIADSYPDMPDSGAFIIFVDEGDEILKSEKAKEYFSSNEVVSFQGGSHQFEHIKESIPNIKRFFNDLETIHY